MTLSSYYTGYTDLDEKLVELYNLQTRAESGQTELNHSIIIHQQDVILRLGKQRDEIDSTQWICKTEGCFETCDSTPCLVALWMKNRRDKK